MLILDSTGEEWDPKMNRGTWMVETEVCAPDSGAWLTTLTYCSMPSVNLAPYSYT